MRITIVGAGNVGTQFAAHCAEKGHEVTVFGSRPEKISKELVVIDENNVVIHKGKIEKATSDPAEAFENAEMIIVTMPATMMKINAEKIAPYVKPGIKIGLVPGTGGGECAFKKCIEKGAVLFGLQRVPSVARLVSYGKSTCAIGYREELFVSAIPNSFTDECCRIVENFLNISTRPLPNYLNITLTPSNPILHTTRLRNVFENYHEGVVYEKVPLFYEDWNDATSRLLLRCDDEVQELCRRMDMFDLSYVKALRIHYESPTAEAMTKKISSIKGFQGITTPVIKTEGGYKPDFSSRYFTADFSYGLAILIQVAAFAGVEVPNMEETLDWYYGLVGKKNLFQFSDYEINNLEELIDYYSA